MQNLPEYSDITSSILDRLRSIAGAKAVFVDEESLAECAADASTEHYRPEAVIYPETTSQVAEIIKLANECGFPVTPRGTGTGLAAGALAAVGGIVLSLERMSRILKIDERNLLAEVEPGVIVSELQNAASAVGLCYPPDPASLATATIGGTAATNAGGPACVKYGVTKHYVLGLEAVLPNGEVITAGTRTRKGVVGYDLAQLLVGSEGTLGIITKLFLKLVPAVEAVSSRVAVFPSLKDAMRAVSSIMAAGVTPSAVEFLDQRCLSLVGDLLPFGELPQGASLLLLETDGSQVAAEADMEAVSRVCEQEGCLHMLSAGNDEERANLWDVRRQVSLRIHESAPVYVPEDVVLPLSEIAAFVEALPALEQKHGLTIYAFGHSGDGNIHINVTAPEGVEERVEACLIELLKLVIDMGGTMSGEHGIGIAKKRFLPLELAPESMRIQKAMKLAFDPNLILNPGKLFI